PLVGDQPRIPSGMQNQNLPQKRNPRTICGPGAPPVGRPRASQPSSKRRLSAGSLRARLQAHPSMRKCSPSPDRETTAQFPTMQRALALSLAIPPENRLLRRVVGTPVAENASDFRFSVPPPLRTLGSLTANNRFRRGTPSD